MVLLGYLSQWNALLLEFSYCMEIFAISVLFGKLIRPMNQIVNY